MALLSRFQTICCRRAGSASTRSARRRTRLMVTPEPAPTTHHVQGRAHDRVGVDRRGHQAHFSESDAGIVQQIRNHLRLQSRIALDRLTALHDGAGKSALRLRTVAHPSIAFRGLRSSCDSVARNSSFCRLLRSASARAARSLASSSRALASACKRSVMSRGDRMRAPEIFSLAIRNSTSATCRLLRRAGGTDALPVTASCRRLRRSSNDSCSVAEYDC